MKIKIDLNNKEIQGIIKLFQENSVEARIVGGAVRDGLIGIGSSDIDIAVATDPIGATKILKNGGYNVIPTGIDFGTITVITKTGYVEITSLREDIKTDGRRAVVEYTNSFESDSKRRDFTINAMSYDPLTETLYDYHNGHVDLQNKCVKFIGDGKSRIKEDYLRILRFFRFTGYYGSKIDPEGLAASKESSSGIAILSKERIHKEIVKILSCPKNIEFIFLSMQDAALWGEIFPSCEIILDGFLNFEKKFWSISSKWDLEIIDLKSLRIAFLFFPCGKVKAKEVLKISKFSGAEIESFEHHFDFIDEILELQTKKYVYLEICKSWYYKHKYINNFLVISFALGKIEEEDVFRSFITMKEQAPKMPVSSEEIMEMGYKGLQIGVRKKFLENQWIKSGFSITKTELLNLKS
ncbi:MAG: CCA tRNA nucleotidyltransferase [Rickettsiaceae bacterium]|nr:CCA tRNA nucleotidyltransferase [Rickettsiaceae bacterium]